MVEEEEDMEDEVVVDMAVEVIVITEDIKYLDLNNKYPTIYLKSNQIKINPQYKFYNILSTKDIMIFIQLNHIITIFYTLYIVSTISLIKNKY